MSGPASVGLLVTLPPECARELELRLTCPHCRNESYFARGAGGFNELALWVNKHIEQCPARPR